MKEVIFKGFYQNGIGNLMMIKSKVKRFDYKIVFVRVKKKLLFGFILYNDIFLFWYIRVKYNFFK